VPLGFRRVVLARLLMTTHETITRPELAKRLDIPEADLLTRDEAAVVIGIGRAYLSNMKLDGPAFYRSTKGSTAGVCWYPRLNVEHYARHRASKSKSRFTGQIGKQEWPQTSEGAELTIPIHRLVEMVQRWKRRELYRRAQLILNDPLAPSDEFKNELRMFGVPWTEGRLAAIAEAVDDLDPGRRQEAFTSLDDQAATMDLKLRAICDAEGLFPTFVHPSYQVLSSIFEDAWREIVLTEGRWRRFDYAGMPSSPPD
jgi:hypothetical protein